MKTLVGITIITTLFAFGSISVKRYSDRGKNVSIELPKEWHHKSIDDGKTMQLFVSLEKVKKDTDIFTVGVTINKIRRMSKSFEQMKTDNDITNIWYAGTKSSFAENYAYEEISLTQVSIGKYDGVFSELTFQASKQSYKLHMYNYILAHDDNLITIVLETPENEWKNYKDIFDESISSIEIN